MRSTTVLFFVSIVLASTTGAQQRAPTEGGMTSALGQPDRWKWAAGAAVGWGRNDERNRGTAAGQIAVYRDILNPVLGVAAFNFEGYAGARDVQSNGGIRARLMSPALRVGIGTDYNIRDRDARLLVSAYSPIVRGGFFDNGTELRLDILPWQHPQVSIAFETPVWRRIPSGKTRPRTDKVSLSADKSKLLSAPDMAGTLAAPLANARAAAALIRTLNVPFLDETSGNRRRDEAAVVARIRELQKALPTGDEPLRTIETEERRFHAEIERAFAIAMSGASAGAGTSVTDATAVAAMARRIMLTEVLMPYDQLLGQVKRADTTEEFAKRARAAFMRWLLGNSVVPRESADAVAWVFSQVLEMVEANRAALRREWGDSRFVWLPLQYGLLPEEHDTQAELDALVELAVRDQFTRANSVSYVIDEQFQYELSRTIRAARDYHVLWIHDFRGHDAQGDPDEMSYWHVLHSYFAALTQRVQEYDRTGTFPTYMILLDEWFYQVNDGRFWMELLEDPTRHQLRFPATHSAWADSIAAAQETLRTAIAKSKLLQSQRGEYGDAWLRDLVSVQVSITNASDPSFWSWRVLRGIPLFDNTMRDHRKLAFYDVSENDPYAGEALFTGAGVGEHYASLAWEDRALLVRGPALLSLKNAARGALMQQGMSSSRIPVALQPRRKSDSYEAKVDSVARGTTRTVRAVAITNGTGFDNKQINVAKGVLYTLMPPGSVIKIPDSLWNSSFWGSALVGCALRGVRVLVIGPSTPNAPARSFGSMIRSQELFWRLLTVAQMMRPQIERAGGMLRVGLYASNTPVTNLPAQVRAVRSAFIQHAWLETLFDLSPEVFDQLARYAGELDTVRIKPSAQDRYESDTIPKLHLKANFFASREGWELMSRPDWVSMLRELVTQRMVQVDSGLGPRTGFSLDVGGAAVQSWLDGLAPETRKRVVFFAMMGSQNQNARSMVIDGEDAIVVSEWPSIVPYLDLISLVGQSKWLDDPADLADYLPPQSGMKRRIAHWFKLAF